MPYCIIFRARPVRTLILQLSSSGFAPECRRRVDRGGPRLVPKDASPSQAPLYKNNKTDIESANMRSIKQ